MFVVQDPPELHQLSVKAITGEPSIGEKINNRSQLLGHHQLAGFYSFLHPPKAKVQINRDVLINDFYVGLHPYFMAA